MSQFETVLYEVSGAVATITLNRAQMMNSLTVLSRKELLSAIESANANADVHVVILTGAGRAFCAGADLVEEKPEGWSVLVELEQEYKPIIMAIQESSKIFIAAVNGAAAGAGSSIAMAADFCIMAEDAYLYEAFAAIGLVPDSGATWFLCQQLGPKRALELILSGERLSASQCVEWGLANRVVTAEKLMEEAQSLAEKMVVKAPLSLKYSKRLVKAMPGLALSAAADEEARYQALCIDSQDFQEGISAFMEKRKPIFTGK